MDNRLVFTTATELRRVPTDTVVFIRAEGNYSNITTADEKTFTLTMQIGQIEQYIAGILESNDNRFIRIGRSLIVNRDYITFINPSQQKISLSDCRTFHYTESASKEALAALKVLLEKEDL